jgi:hypothetical protein
MDFALGHSSDTDDACLLAGLVRIWLVSGPSAREA